MRSGPRARDGGRHRGIDVRCHLDHAEEARELQHAAHGRGRAGEDEGTVGPHPLGGDQEDRSGAKAPSNLHRVDSNRGRVSSSLPSIKTQRPRRVAGKNDRLAPATTAGKNTKAKVIQWP